MANIRIIADDLGLAACINDGILLGLKDKWLSGASLMANGKAFDHAVRKLKEIPDASIGIHLGLVEERPLSSPEQVPSLVGKDGTLLKNHRIFFLKYILGRIDMREVEMEFKAQLEKLAKNGIQPKFLNSHQHLHLLPGIMDVIIKLAKEHGIPYIRIVKEPLFGHGGSFARMIQLVVLRCLSSLAVSKIKSAGLKHNDLFVGFLNAGNMGEPDLRISQRLSQDYPEKIVELGSHPGFEDENLKKAYSHWDYHWKEEADFLQGIKI